MNDPSRAHSSSPSELKAQIEAEREGKPFLVYRDGESNQGIVELGEGVERLTIGRASATGLTLDWDEQVSRVHAELEQLGEGWAIADDGLSRNGTFVNGERLGGRRLLEDGDAVRIGETIIIYRHPEEITAGATVVASDMPDATSLSETQKKVLVALCRPYKDGGQYATPATNQGIADELFLSIDAVKTHLRSLFSKFGVEDLPQNQKRVKLVERALQSGVIAPRDL